MKGVIMSAQMHHGLALMKRRKNLGLTGQQVADMLGTNQGTISKMENSKHPWVSLYCQSYKQLLDLCECQRLRELGEQHPEERAKIIYEELLNKPGEDDQPRSA
jgi:transcriptional regulator with XRE-family HTH domain